MNKLYNLINPFEYNNDEIKHNITSFVDNLYKRGFIFEPSEVDFKHMNIISGTDADTESGEDNYEWIIENPIVEYNLF